MEELNAAGYNVFDCEKDNKILTVSNEEDTKRNPMSTYPYQEFNSEFESIVAKHKCSFEPYDSGTIHIYGGL